MKNIGIFNHDCTDHLEFDHGESGGWSVVIKCEKCSQKWYPQWMVNDKKRKRDAEKCLFLHTMGRNMCTPPCSVCERQVIGYREIDTPDNTSIDLKPYPPARPDYIRAMDKDWQYKKDLFDILEGLARGYPVGNVCINDLRKKYL